MPYIPKDDRKQYDKDIKNILRTVTQEDEKQRKFLPGHLNYVITKLLLMYAFSKTESYSSYNEVIGVLEAVKLEMYRKYTSIYEDKAIRKNGKVDV